MSTDSDVGVIYLEEMAMGRGDMERLAENAESVAGLSVDGKAVWYDGELNAAVVAESTPEGVPDDYEYVAPGEETPDGHDVVESNRGGTYMSPEPVDESDVDDSDASGGAAAAAETAEQLGVDDPEAVAETYREGDPLGASDIVPAEVDAVSPEEFAELVAERQDSVGDILDTDEIAQVVIRDTLEERLSEPDELPEPTGRTVDESSLEVPEDVLELEPGDTVSRGGGDVLVTNTGTADAGPFVEYHDGDEEYVAFGDTFIPTEMTGREKTSAETQLEESDAVLGGAFIEELPAAEQQMVADRIEELSTGDELIVNVSTSQAAYARQADDTDLDDAEAAFGAYVNGGLLYLNDEAWGEWGENWGATFAAPDDVDPGEYIVTHEMGHAAHNAHGDWTADRMQSWDQDELDTVRDSDVIGFYGRTKPSEMVAEVYAARVYGRDIEDDVMELYRKYDGPPIPETRDQIEERLADEELAEADATTPDAEPEFETYRECVDVNGDKSDPESYCAVIFGFDESAADDGDEDEDEGAVEAAAGGVTAAETDPVAEVELRARLLAQSASRDAANRRQQALEEEVADADSDEAVESQSTPEGVPDDYEYLAPGEEAPDDHAVVESPHGGRYVSPAPVDDEDDPDRTDPEDDPEQARGEQLQAEVSDILGEDPGRDEYRAVENYVENETGVDDVDFSDFDAQQVETVSAEIGRMDARGDLEGLESVQSSVPNTERETYGDLPMHYDRDERGVSIDARALDQDITQSMHDADITSTPEVEHFLQHIAATHNHAEALENGETTAEGDPSESAEQQLEEEDDIDVGEIAAQTGLLALATGATLVAETYTMAVNGRPTNDQLIRAYRFFGGPTLDDVRGDDE